MSPKAPKIAESVTLGVDDRLWLAITEAAGLATEGDQAKRIGCSRTYLNRVRNGHAAPGPEFIAKVRRAFPAVDVGALFPVIEKSSR